MSEVALTSLEQENLRLVTDFCNMWAEKDIEKLLPFISDELVYDMWEGGPVLEGKEAFIEMLSPLLEDCTKVDWITHRSHVMGKVVMNERLDHFIRDDPENPDWHFPVTGVFVVEEGKIVYWKDYLVPGKPVDMGG